VIDSSDLHCIPGRGAGQAEGLNVVLQQSQPAPTDAGPLSVYAYLKKKPYLNVEAAAADVRPPPSPHSPTPR
jgi:hypothetical protein